MKTAKFIFLCSALFWSLSCSTETEVTEGEKTTSEQAEGESAEEEPQLTCVDLIQDYDSYAGKEVTLSAYSWGTTETTDGKTLLSVAEFKLEGISAQTVVLDITDKSSIADIKTNDRFKFKATVGIREYGTIHLTNPTILK